jgi:hypothetical protein
VNEVEKKSGSFAIFSFYVKFKYIVLDLVLQVILCIFICQVSWL